MSKETKSQETEIDDVDGLEVEWPDGPGRNAEIVLTLLTSPRVRISLSNSAVRDLYRQLSKGYARAVD